MGIYIIEKLNSLNLKRLEKFFFALFLLSIPLQTRLTFSTPQTYANGYFNEYAAFFIYLSDIFLITTFFLFFVNSLTKTKDFSIKFNRIYASPHFIPIAFLVGLILWSFLSVSWAEYQNIALFQSLKLTELILLALYINNRLLWFGLNKAFALIFITGTFQALIGIGQYLTQKSLGLKILGESILALTLDNVAKIVVDGERILRAYGTFPHPNIFSAFLVLSIFCGFWLLFSLKIKDNSKIVSRLPAVANTILNFLASLKGKKAIVSRETILHPLFTIAIILQLLAIILTFSRIAWLGLIITLFFGFQALKTLYLTEKIKIVSRETILEANFVKKLFHVKQFWGNGLNKIQKYSILTIIFSFIVIISMFWNQITSRTIDISNKYQQSIGYRMLYNDIAINIIKDRPLTGIGNGNFTLKMKDYSPVSLEWWQYQPVHNIYLLITSELGIVGLLVFLLFIFYLLKMACLEQKKNYGFRPPTFLLKLFHVKQLSNYPLNKPKDLLYEEISAGRCETIYNKAKAGETPYFKYLILSIFIGFLFMGLFDHYFWTLQQGRLAFWLVIGMLLALNREK